METKQSPPGATAIRNIKLQMVDQDLTRNALSIKSGIAPQTLARRFEHPEQLTLKELGDLAYALKVTFPDLIKASA